MSLQRVRFSSSSDGSSAYTVAVNPVDIEVPRSDFETFTAHQVLDGPAVYIGAAADNRMYKLEWRGIAQETYSTMISELVSYEFQHSIQNYKYIHMGTIGDNLGKFSTWTRVRVMKVEIIYRPGSAFIIDSLGVFFEKG